MGGLSYESEYSTHIAPARLYKALVLDGNKFMPKAAPQIIASSEIIQGDGGAGTIMKITFAEGSPLKYVDHRVDVVDKDNLVYIYSLVGGDGWSEKLEKITYEYKFVAAPGGGTVMKGVTTYHAKGGEDHGIPQEKVNHGKNLPAQLLKAVEKYLAENPGACN